MGNDNDLGVLTRTSDQPGKCRKQVGVQAGFWFVQHHERRRSRAEEGGDQQQVAKGAVRKLGRAQRPQQTVGTQFKIEAATGLDHLEP